jgi:hypothetical protein
MALKDGEFARRLRPTAEMLYDHVTVSVLIALEKWRLHNSAGRGRIPGS